MSLKMNTKEKSVNTLQLIYDDDRQLMHGRIAHEITKYS